jgi:hypothetical protein
MFRSRPCLEDPDLRLDTRPLPHTTWSRGSVTGRRQLLNDSQYGDAELFARYTSHVPIDLWRRSYVRSQGCGFWQTAGFDSKCGACTTVGAWFRSSQVVFSRIVSLYDTER